MPLRQLPDGSWLDTTSGALSGYDPARESAARMISMRATGQVRGQLAGGGNPTPPLPSQKMVVLPGARGPQAIIDPQRNSLRLNPFELGLGNILTPENKKKLMVLGIFMGGCAAWVWWQKRKTKPAEASE